MNHLGGCGEANDHTDKKSVRYEINRTGRCMSHICHRLPIATLMFTLLWDFLALAFSLMSSAGDIETV